jgi:diguanylate cyclase (GGDEF)-like protein
MQSDFYKNMLSLHRFWSFAFVVSFLLCCIALMVSPANAEDDAESIQERLNKATQLQLSDLGLTEEEQAWLQAHSVIRVGVRHGYSPIEYISEGNQFRGITIDYLYRLEALLGITFKMVDSQDYSDTDSIDMFSGVTNPNVLKEHQFTALGHPFLTFPYAIYTHKGYKAINDFSDLENKKIAVFKKSAVTHLLLAEFPALELMDVEIAEDAFSAMAAHQVDAYVGNEMIVDYVANIEGVRYIKKVGYTPFNAQVFMAVRSDWPLWKSILQKSLASLAPEQGKILKKWNLSNDRDNLQLLIIALITLSSIAAIVIFKSYRLKQAIKIQDKLSQERIWHQANFDYLTSLPNRMMFHNRLQEEIKKSARSNLPLGLLFIDLDNFKQINDQLGHPVGDELIIQVARRISECVRAIDTTARIGGDEFTVIMGELSDVNSLENTSIKMLQRLEEPFHIHPHDIYVTASIGITVYPDDAQKIEELIMFADQAMYEAKRLGRNRYHFFTASMQEASIYRHTITNDLRAALLNKQFVMFYQPITDLNTSHVVKAEALIRWQHPTKGIITPVEFIHIAEDTGMIDHIGNWVFEQVLKDAVYLRKYFSPDFQITFNVSPRQFMDEENVLSWIAKLEKNGLEGNAISIEITEGLLLQATSSVKHILSEFLRSGTEIAIDDFGTGYSALAYLKKFDVDYVKLDRSFIQNIESDHDTRVLCEAIISMAHKLKIKVVAEGIETLAQQTLLKTYRCDFGQGYLISKPMTLPEFSAFLQVYHTD